MKQITEYHFIKCTDINMEYPFFEVIDNNDKTIMDFSLSEKKEIEVLFYPDISEKRISLELFEQIVGKARKLLDEEMRAPE